MAGGSKEFVINNLRLAQQLEWLRRAPNLIDTKSLALPEELFTATDSPLLGGDITARRLGLQFEQLVKFGLRSNPQVTDIESNIPVRSSGKTVGEADLLFRFNAQWWHVELALKFYLRELNTEGLAAYYGPNRKDRFDQKWQYMLEHQSQLLARPEAAGLRAARGINQISRAILIKGWLFQHPNDRREIAPSPINPLHPRGWWLHQRELAGWLSGQPATARFMLVEKPYWLYPPARIQGASMDRRRLLAQVERRQSAVQIWVVLGEGYSRQLLSRGYVVPDNWGLDEQ